MVAARAVAGPGVPVTICYDNGMEELVPAEWKDYTQTSGGAALAVKWALVVAARAIAGPGVPVTIKHANGTLERVPAEWTNKKKNYKEADRLRGITAMAIAGPGADVTNPGTFLLPFAIPPPARFVCVCVLRVCVSTAPLNEQLLAEGPLSALLFAFDLFKCSPPPLTHTFAALTAELLRKQGHLKNTQSRAWCMACMAQHFQRDCLLNMAGGGGGSEE